MAARRKSTSDWPKLVSAYLNRSCTQEEFCKRHQVNASTLSYHVSRATRRSAFVPALREEEHATEIVLELPEGITLTLRR